MDRINALLADKEFIQYFHRMEQLEQNRIYCRHGLNHCLDVARIGYILLLEDGLLSSPRCFTPSTDGLLTKELFYAAALTHDLGRVEEYTDGTPHDEAGVKIAKNLLMKHGFTEAETEMVCQAIAEHRTLRGKTSTAFSQTGSPQCIALSSDSLARYLWRADKLSRNCFDCKAADTCKWSDGGHVSSEHSFIGGQKVKNTGICC